MPAGPIEREGELGALDAAIAMALAGRGNLLLFEGQPGVGKTTLIEAAADRTAAEGMVVLRASGAALEQDLGWGVVRTAFAPQLAERSKRERLLRDAAAAAAPLFSGASSAPAADATGAILHGLYWLLSDLASERPVAVIVDDAHWVDAPSGRWLGHLAVRVAELPVALVLAARPKPPQPWWSEAVVSAHAKLLALEPLTLAGTRTLIADALPNASNEIADACHEATGGNPFLLIELLRQTASELADPRQIRTLRPDSIRRAVVLRLAQLGEQARGFCFAAAVLGQEATVSLVAELAGLDSGTAELAATALEQSDVIRIGSRIEFVHPLVLDVVDREIPAARRAALHLEAVAVLERRSAPPSVIAPHLLAAERGGRAAVVETLRRAGAEAIALGALETAAACLRRALEEPPGEASLTEVLVELGRVEGMLAVPTGVEHLRQALTRCTDAAERGRIARELAPQLGLAGAVAEAVALLDEAAAALPAEERELALELRAQALIFGGQILPHRPADPQAVATARTLTGSTRGERAFLAIVSNVVNGSLAPAREVYEFAARALAGGTLLEDVTADSPSFWSAVTASMFAEEYGQAERSIGAALADSARRGSVRGHGYCCGFGSPLHFRLGRLQEASDVAGRALEIFADEPVLQAYPRAFLVEALIDQGALAEARAVIGESLDGELPPLVSFALLSGCDARLRRLEGDAGGAVSAILKTGALLEDVSPAVWPWRAEAALALHAAGEQDQAAGIAREEVQRGGHVGSRWVQARALHALGVVEQSVEPWRRAEELTRGWPTVLERARVLVDLGSALRRSGRTRDAQPSLREGLDLADRCGAMPLATRAREELMAAGARPRRPRLTGRDSLTASELRVCRMAAAGATNREIAQALFVGLRTVETHLTHAYSKLGIAGRDGLEGVEFSEPSVSR